jgi:SPW repeat
MAAEDREVQVAAIEDTRKGVNMNRWQHWLIALLGLWMLTSHLVLHYSAFHSGVLWNTWVVGVAIILVSAGRFIAEIPEPSQDVVHAVLGLWLIVSPWFLGFTSQVTARNNAVVVGSLVAAAALWAMLVETDLRKWMSDWMHQHHVLR